MSEDIIKIGEDDYEQISNYSTEQVIQNFVLDGLKPKKKGPKKPKEDKQEKLDDSKQLDEDSYVEVIEPPFNPLLWASLMEKNTRLSKLIRTYARNTVGLGWQIRPKKTVKKDTSDEKKELINAEIEILDNFFSYCNPLLPFEEIIYRAKIDEEAMGNGYIEILRNMKGTPTGIYHIPGHTVRVLKNRKGFVQIRGLEKRYFKIFNGEFDMNFETGEVKPLGGVAFTEKASELIPFQIYNPRDSYYGTPRYVSTADAIAGNKLASRRNLSFFKNDATPRMAITVTNGQLTSGSISDIKDFVNTEGKGIENAHRVMILQAKSKQIGDMNAKDVKIDVIPLTVGQTDDASFISYRNANDEEIREAFGIGEIFLGGKGSINRSTATIMREITNEQEFIPDIKIKEYLINQTICKAFGVKHVEFKFDRPSSLGSLDKADIYARYQQGGGVTPNDIRHELGKDEYTEDWGDKPIQIGLVEFQMGLLGAQGAVSQGGEVEVEKEEPSGEESIEKTSEGVENKVFDQSGNEIRINKRVKANKTELENIIIENIHDMIKQNLQTVQIEIEDYDK